MGYRLYMAYKYTGVDRSFFDYLRGAGDVFNRTKYIIRTCQMPAIITIHPSCLCEPAPRGLRSRLLD